jgi:hypothetical protein
MNAPDTPVTPNTPVIPAKAGIHDVPPCWIPAFAGMTAAALSRATS